MEFYCIGISHHTASLEMRERLTCPPEELDALLGHYRSHRDSYLGTQSEIVVLSTCNRFEIYATIRTEHHPFVGKPGEAFRKLEQFLADRLGFEDSHALFTRYHNLTAVEHLFRVSAGLESQVLGEAQILGQVSDALDRALQMQSARHTLASLFRSAIHAARRAHSETGIGTNPASISSVAAAIAEEVYQELENRRVLVIGAGEMSTLAVKAFYHRGARRITVINRTPHNALRLVAQYGCQVRPLDELPDALVDADVVISSTQAQQPLITKEMLQSVLQRRIGRPCCCWISPCRAISNLLCVI
jgi:glutamyl-tRNA reductase